VPGRVAGAATPGQILRRRGLGRRTSGNTDSDVMRMTGDSGTMKRKARTSDSEESSEGWESEPAGPGSGAPGPGEEEPGADASDVAAATVHARGQDGEADGGSGGGGDDDDEDDERGAFDMDELRRAAEAAEERHVTSPIRGAGEADAARRAMQSDSDCDGGGGPGGGPGASEASGADGGDGGDDADDGGGSSSGGGGGGGGVGRKWQRRHPLEDVGGLCLREKESEREREERTREREEGEREKDVGSCSCLHLFPFLETQLHSSLTSPSSTPPALSPSPKAQLQP
jgi:hypothetical protein